MTLGNKTIDSFDDTQTINIYPNPSNGKIIIELSGYSPAMDAYLEIISPDGRLMKSQAIHESVSHIDISSIRQGVYFAKIFPRGSPLVKKFIRQ